MRHRCLELAIRPGIEAVGLVSDRAFPRHAHDDYGIGVIMAGAQTSWSGCGEVEAGAGDLITVNPGEVHDGSPLGGRPRAWRMIYFAPSVVSTALEGEAHRTPEFARPALRDPDLATLFLAAFAPLMEEIADPLAFETAAGVVIGQVWSRHGSETPAAKASIGSVGRARRRIDDTPEAPVTLGELAAETGLSRFQFLRAFFREHGMTPHAYLLQRRTRLARRLLGEGMPPAEAAIASGFFDQSHLNRIFLRQFGMTPGRYRAAAVGRTRQVSQFSPR